MKRLLLVYTLAVVLVAGGLACWRSFALGFAPPDKEQPSLWVLKPARVFDGTAFHEDWVVVVRGNKIDQRRPGRQGYDSPGSARQWSCRT